MKSTHRATAAIRAAALGTTLTVGMVMAGYGTLASAGEFGVRVVDDAGAPVQGASVCFGLPGSYRQFGAQFTDVDGRAVAEIPNIPVVVTVSKTRFSGVRLSEPARGFNMEKQVTLSEGTPGPRCKAGSSLAEANHSSIRITRLDVAPESDATVIKPTVTGEPTEYRVGVTSDLQSIEWAPFDGSIRVTGSFADEDELFMQLRRYEGTTTGWIEARSDVLTVFVPRTLSPL